MSKIGTWNEKSSSGTKIVFVVPTLNEEAGVPIVLDSISKVMHRSNYLVLVVDGNSEDKTVQRAKDRGALIIFQRERGYGDALMTGFSCACDKLRADIIVMMDADGTYDPKDVPKMLTPILEKRADLVIGNRFLRMKPGSMTFINRIGNKILSWIARKTLSIKINDTQCGLRAFRADLIKRISLSTNGMPFATEMLAEAREANARVLELPVDYSPRIGNAKLDPIKDGMRILGTILRLIRDYRPLLFFGGSGFILVLLGSLIGFNTVIELALTGSIAHLASVSLASMLIVVGFFTFMIGLLADMVKDLKKEIRAKAK